MRPLLLMPSVELPMERDPGEGWAEMSGGDAMRPSLWGRRWSSLWCTIRVRGVRSERRDANLVSGAVGGAP